MKLFGVFILLFASYTFSPGWYAETNSGSKRSQAQADEKETRTPARKKIDSQLLYAIYQMRGEGEDKGVPTEPIILRRDAKHRVLVDIRSEVTRKLTSTLRSCGSKILSVSSKHHSVIAYVPLEQLEKIAELKEVKFISQPAEAVTN